MKAGLVAILVLVSVLLGLFLWFSGGEQPSAREVVSRPDAALPAQSDTSVPSTTQAQVQRPDAPREPVVPTPSTKAEPKPMVGVRKLRVTGTAVRPSGEPVPHAQVRMGTLSWGAWVGCGPDGRFEIYVPGAGQYRWTAEHQNVGRALEQEVEITSSETDLGEIILWGVGVLVGRTEYPDGSPAPYVPMSVTYIAPEAAQAHVVRGLERAQTTSDESGRFQIEGLAEGTYRFAGPSGFSGPGQVFYETGELDALIVVASRRLTVHVQDALGKPHGVTEFMLYRETGDPVSPFLNEVHTYTVSPESTHSCWIGKTGTFLVRVRDMAGERGEVEIALEAHEWSPERVVVVGGESRTGTLEVLVEDDAGKRVTPNLVELYDAASDSWISTHPLEAGARIEDLLEGDYRVLVKPGIHSRGELGDYLDAEPMERVRVAPDREASVKVNARRGGRIALMVEAVGEAQVGETSIWIRPEGVEEADTLTWRLERDEGFSLKRSLDFGELGITERPLAPGSYVLNVTARGYESREELVRVQAGATSNVRVSLAPE